MRFPRVRLASVSISWEKLGADEGGGQENVFLYQRAIHILRLSS